MPKKILIFILKILAQAALWRYKPLIIGVTGNVGKTSTKEAIYAVLKEKFSARRNIKNYNNEIGAPLTILGQVSGGKSWWQWLKIFLIGFFEIFYTKDYPKILILEMGADKIGDISYLTDFIKCHAGVITAIGAIPVHVEFFQSVDQVAREKSNLIRNLDKSGWAVLNYDDERVRAMMKKTSAQIFTYGFDEQADLRASNFEQHLDNLNEAGISFKVDYQGSNVPIRLKDIYARHQVYSILAGMAIGLIFKMNLVEIGEALKNHQSPVGRLHLLRGIKNTWIIDDTYNSSPVACEGALKTLGEIKCRVEGCRKIAVLGDMLELGKHTIEAHKNIGRLAKENAEAVIVVGQRAKNIAEGAREAGMRADSIFECVDSRGAGEFLKTFVQKNDIVLIKGSQGMRMERTVEQVMLGQDSKEKLLVRQDKEWLDKE